MTAHKPVQLPPEAIAAMPALFVLIWSTGFIVARYGMPYAEPATFLILRFAGVLAVMLPFVLMLKVPFPPSRHVAHIAVAGVLLQAGYLGGVWVAIKLGMSAGMSALIVGLQPVLTAVAGPLFGERTGPRQWAGLALGFIGVALVVWNKVGLASAGPASIGFALMALASITAGTLYQRRFCPSFDLRIGSVVQFAASLLALLPFALVFETRDVQWTVPLIGSLAWSVLALSVGAMSLLFLLIRNGAATRVASLMYLTPAVTALMAWVLFDERLSTLAIAGMVLAAVGVALVVKR